MIEEQFKETFARLIGDARDDQYADSYERDVSIIELLDGRRAKVTMKLDTDDREW